MAEKKSGPAPSPKVAVVNAANETIREIQLSPEVFAAKPNAHLVYEAVKQYRAGGRRGTHMTKNRALVSGTGRKPWRQKGTGRARVGEARNPLWRHGGTVFGPVMGALVIVAMENYLSQFGAWVTIVQGTIFVVCVLTFRRGIIGELARVLRRPL